MTSEMKRLLDERTEALEQLGRVEGEIASITDRINEIMGGKSEAKVGEGELYRAHYTRRKSLTAATALNRKVDDLTGRINALARIRAAEIGAGR